MRESISGPHLRCITSAGLLCVLPVPSLCEKTAVGARGCPGWPLWRSRADGLRCKCLQLLWGDSLSSTFYLFLTHRLYTAGNSGPWMANAFNYWLVVNQKVWELEIKRQPQATGIIDGSGAISSMTHQRLWLLCRYWILIPASMAPFSRWLAFLTHFIRLSSCQKWNESCPPATVRSLPPVPPRCCTHSQFSKVKQLQKCLDYPFQCPSFVHMSFVCQPQEKLRTGHHWFGLHGAWQTQGHQ